MAPGPKHARRRRFGPGWSVPVAIVAVLLAAEVFARVVGPNIGRTSGSEERAFIKADQIYRRSGETDVVFFGSSETAGGIIPAKVLAEVPQLTGGYNAALAGARLDLSKEWAERIVLPRLDPKVVVISMQPTAVVDFEKSDFDPAKDTGPAYRSAFDQIDPGGLGSLGWELRQRSALIRYRPYLRSPSLVWKGIVATVSGDENPPVSDVGMDWETETDPDRVLALTEPDGEVLDYRAPPGPLGDEAMAVAAFNAAGALPVDMEPLQEMVDTVRASGATPVIAIAPLDRTVLEDRGVDLTALDGRVDELAAWADEHDVAFFSEFGETWPPEWFHDRQHVAGPGAEAWSRNLGQFLAEQCDQRKLGDACTS